MHGGGVGEGAEGSPTSRPAVLVGRSPEQLVPATSADPGVLRACCRHLQAVLLQAAQPRMVQLHVGVPAAGELGGGAPRACGRPRAAATPPQLLRDGL